MKYLKLKVIRKQLSILYAAVPDDFTLKDALQARHERQLGKIALETLSAFDWNDDAIEVISAEPVTDAEARAYKVGVLVPEKGGDK